MVMKKQLLQLKLSAILFLFLLIQSTYLWAEVTASTGRSVLGIDETIVLEIKSENSSGEPDLSELEENFQILGRSQSQNYSLINGHASRTHIWGITLLPKRTGEITIPEIRVGDETTKPIHLVIQKQSNSPGVDGKDVFLTVSIVDNKTEDLYVQQQIIIKVQLFHSIPFSNASLSELELDNTVVEKLGNDSNYNKVINNNRYKVIERNYAVYPQQSGQLIIPAMTFTGNAQISQNFSLFSRPGQQIISRTKPLTLTILPIPESYTGKNWLPAEEVLIESEIVDDINLIHTGEAITQHIVVRATGLLASQLPATSVPSSNSIKTYPDKEKLSNQIIGGKVVGLRRDTIAIIPLQAGQFILPEIKIDWWNTKTNQQETAILPARTLLAQRNPDLANNSSTPAVIAADPKVQTPIITKNDADNTDPEKIIEKIIYKEPAFSKNPWFWISSGLLIIWLITLILLIIVSTRKKHSTINSSTQKSLNNSDNNHEKYLYILYEHCRENDANQVTTALVQWAKYYFNKPMLSGLSQVIELIDNEELIHEINNLEGSQYSVNKQNWNGEALTLAVTHFVEQEKTQRETTEQAAEQNFSPLNP